MGGSFIFVPYDTVWDEIITSMYTKNWIAFGTGVFQTLGYGTVIIDDFFYRLPSRSENVVYRGAWLRLM
jgi:hypothetical protein